MCCDNSTHNFKKSIGPQELKCQAYEYITPIVSLSLTNVSMELPVDSNNTVCKLCIVEDTNIFMCL